MRRLVWKGDWAVLSVQTSILLPGKAENVNDFRFGGGSTDMETRLLAGRGFELGSWDGFAEAQLGFRKRGGGYPDETRLDLTLGLKPSDRFEIMAQTYMIRSHNRGMRTRRYENTRLHLSALWWIKPDVGLQAGFYRTVQGKNVIQENAIMVSHWIRF